MILITNKSRHEHNKSVLDKSKYYKWICPFCTDKSSDAEFIIELYDNEIYICKKHLIQLTREVFSLLTKNKFFFGKCVTIHFYGDNIYLKKKETQSLLDTLLENITLEEFLFD